MSAGCSTASDGTICSVRAAIVCQPIDGGGGDGSETAHKVEIKCVGSSDSPSVAGTEYTLIRGANSHTLTDCGLRESATPRGEWQVPT